MCNSLALKLAKVTRDTPDPAGGKFERDEKGEPTGLLKERAAGIVRSAIRSPKVPEADAVAGYRNCFRKFIAAGLTGVHVAGTTPATARLMAAARQGAPVRLYIMLLEALHRSGRRAEADDAPRRVGRPLRGDQALLWSVAVRADGLALQAVRQPG